MPPGVAAPWSLLNHGQSVRPGRAPAGRRRSCGPRSLPRRSGPRPDGARRPPSSRPVRGRSRRRVSAPRQVGDEAVGVERRARPVVGLVDGDQQAGDAVVDDLGDAARRGADHGQAARPWPRGSRCRAARRPTGTRRPCTAARTATRSGPRQHLLDPDDAGAGLAAGSRPGARTSAMISGVSGAPAHSTSWTSGGSSAAARSRYGRPFCRVIRPTKTTAGRSGSMPCRARAAASAPASSESGRRQPDRSMPLCTTCTRSGSTLRVDAQDVGAHARRDRDDAGRTQVGGPLRPRRERRTRRRAARPSTGAAAPGSAR